MVTVPKPTTDHLGTAWAEQLATSRRTVERTEDPYAAVEQVDAHLASAADGYRGAYPMPATAEEDDGWAEARIAEDAPPEDVAGAAAHYRATYARQQEDDAVGDARLPGAFVASDSQLWIPGAWEAFVANLEAGAGPHPWWYERGMSDQLIRLMAAQDHAGDADSDDDVDGWF